MMSNTKGPGGKIFLMVLAKLTMKMSLNIREVSREGYSMGEGDYSYQAIFSLMENLKMELSKVKGSLPALKAKLKFLANGLMAELKGN